MNDCLVQIGASAINKNSLAERLRLSFWWVPQNGYLERIAAAVNAATRGSFAEVEIPFY